MDSPTRAERIAALGFDPATQPHEVVAHCNLCGELGRPVEVARRDRYGYATRLLVCARCSLGWLSPRLRADGYAHFYTGVYRPLVSAYHGRRIDAETVQIDQQAYASDLADFLTPLLVEQPQTILDVGGSTGTVAGVLAPRLGAKATVLDPSPDELAVARAAGMKTVAGLAEDFDPGDRCWDLVLLCQTIDHLLDVRATLTALRAMMAPEGRAFVDVLDVGFMLTKTGSIEGAVKIDHPFYLTGVTANALFAVTGYAVVARRMADDGHLGYLLAPAPPVEPDWAALEAGARAFLADVWRRRAGG